MSAARHLAALDIGTAKVCAAVARVDQKGAEVLACGVAPAAGFRRGAVVDIDEAAASIRAAVKEAETGSGVEIRGVYLGMAGTHIKVEESYGATAIKGKEVRPRDIERVIETASALYVPLDREVLHVIPSEFVMDGQDGISRPLGMSGVRLEVKVRVVSASATILENLEKAVSRAGLRASEIVFQPFATALAVLKEEEAESGVLLIDYGGASTDTAIYKAGTLRHSSVIPVGSQHITSDISVGLRITQKEAERLKRRCGLDGFQANDPLDALSMSGKPVRVQRTGLEGIIRPRAEELFELIKADISSAVLKYRPLCAVLTGGGGLLKGLSDMAEMWLGLPVRVGAPEKIKSPLFKEMASDPQYAAAAGLLLYGLRAEGAEPAPGLSSFADAFEAIRDGIFSRGLMAAGKVLTKKARNIGNLLHRG